TSTEAGKRTASDFEMPGGKGIIISDRTGGVQAFRHEGDLTNADLHAYLQRYTGDRAITRTETADSIRDSSFEEAPKDPKKDPKKDGAAKPPAVPHDHVVWVSSGCGGGGCGYASCGSGGHHRGHRHGR